MHFLAFTAARLITLASDLFETLLIFEIATEEQIQLTKGTTGRTSNTDECIFHIT